MALHEADKQQLHSCSQLSTAGVRRSGVSAHCSPVRSPSYCAAHAMDDKQPEITNTDISYLAGLTVPAHAL